MGLNRRDFLKSMMALSVVTIVPTVNAETVSFVEPTRDLETTSFIGSDGEERYHVVIVRKFQCVDTYINGELYRVDVFRNDEDYDAYRGELFRRATEYAMSDFTVWNRELSIEQINEIHKMRVL